MQFVFYTEKTVAQSLAALNERMHVKGTSSRPALDGWVEKGGGFAIGVTTEVAGRFTRTTYMRGKMERQGSHTAVKVTVSKGATRENKIVIYGALGLTALALIALGNIWMALVVLPVALALWIPLTGDHNNSEMLLSELQKTLKARTTAPKPAPGMARPAAPLRSAAARKPADARPVPAKPASSEKPNAAAKPARPAAPRPTVVKQAEPPKLTLDG